MSRHNTFNPLQDYLKQIEKGKPGALSGLFLLLFLLADIYVLFCFPLSELMMNLFIFLPIELNLKRMP